MFSSRSEAIIVIIIIRYIIIYLNEKNWKIKKNLYIIIKLSSLFLKRDTYT